MKVILGWSLAIFGLCCSQIQANDRYTTISKKEEALISHVIQCIAMGDREESKLNGSILQMEGMSGCKFRHFLNNLCSFPGTRYFEVGCWKGSTLVSAMYQNESTLDEVIACDNFSEFDGPKNQFFSNVKRFAPNSKLRFFDSDAFGLDKKAVFHAPINVYLYDGAHDHLSQELAFTYFNDIFDDLFVAIVDDWNLDAPRKGTGLAFRKLGYKILFETTIFTERNGNGNPYTWWDGFHVAVVKKKRK